MTNRSIYIIISIIIFTSIAAAELSAPTVNRAGARSWGTYYDLMGEIGILNGTLNLIYNITDNNGNYYLKNISILCSSNCTITKYANGSIFIDPISGTGGGGAGNVSSVTATLPVTSSGGDTPNIACPTCVTNTTVDKNLSNFTNTPGYVTNTTVDKNLSNFTNTPGYVTNTTAQVTRSQVTDLNTSFQNSSFGIFLTNGSNAIAVGYFDVIQLLPVSGTITNLSIEGRYAGAINLSLMYNATSAPVYPGDVVASINVTSGASASSTGLSIAVAQNGNLMAYVDANSGSVNKTNLRGILRRS